MLLRHDDEDDDDDDDDRYVNYDDSIFIMHLFSLYFTQLTFC